eukprot:1670004-Amphidinium_carterae.1
MLKTILMVKHSNWLEVTVELCMLAPSEEIVSKLIPQRIHPVAVAQFNLPQTPTAKENHPNVLTSMCSF